MMSINFRQHFQHLRDGIAVVLQQTNIKGMTWLTLVCSQLQEQESLSTCSCMRAQAAFRRMLIRPRNKLNRSVRISSFAERGMKKKIGHNTGSRKRRNKLERYPFLPSRSPSWEERLHGDPQCCVLGKANCDFLSSFVQNVTEEWKRMGDTN